MDFGGRYLFATDRLAVWAALNDTAVLKAAIPGCRRIDWVSETELEAEIVVNLGVAKPVFTGDLVLDPIVPAERYRLSGRGRGGLLGMAHGAAEVILNDHPGGTELAFVAEGGASGQIVKLGRRILGAGAQGVIDRFFERIGGAMGVKVTALPREGPD